MKKVFTDLFEYNFNNNRKVIDLLNQLYPNVTKKQLKLINHIVNAQQIWNARITDSDSFNVWQINNWNDLIDLNQTNYNNSINIINHYDIKQSITYHNSKGEFFNNTITDILLHIINHSTYHRAQIATDLKNEGIEPVNTDYIFYQRKTQ